MAQLTDDDFDKIYEYDETILSDEFDNDSQLGMLETYGADLEQVLAISKVSPKKVWTMVDGDEGMYLTSGYHLCNRIYYVITTEDCKTENEDYLIDVFD